MFLPRVFAVEVVHMEENARTEQDLYHQLRSRLHMKNNPLARHSLASRGWRRPDSNLYTKARCGCGALSTLA